MSALTDLTALVAAAPAYVGQAPTGSEAPYVVSAPLVYQDGAPRALSGDSMGWDTQFSLYCAGASVEASFNLALMVMRDLDGKRLGGSTITTSVGYTGAPVEGHYETQVTAQINQGGI